MERFRDPFADISDEDLLHKEEQDEIYEGSQSSVGRFEQFEFARYDWSAFSPEAYGYNVIRLSGDQNNNRRKSPYSGIFFSIVDCFHHGVVTAGGKRWYPLVEFYRDARGDSAENIKRIVAHRNTGSRKKRRVEYLHRVVGKASGRFIRDHINGHSLDNRSCNLRDVSETMNNHNALRQRSAHHVLMPGVEWNTNTRKVELRTQVRGVIQVRGERIRSEERWPLEEQIKAHYWHLEQLKKLYNDDRWAFNQAVALPKFPPLVKKVFVVPALPQGMHTEIPF